MKVTVIRDGKSKEYEVGSSDVLLEELEVVGARMPYGCRAGSCGACRVLVREGAESLVPPDPMEQDTLERCPDQGISRLACRMQATSSVTVEIPSEE